MPSLSRRRLLGLVGAGSLAGCSSMGTPTETDSIEPTPSGPGSAGPAVDCGGGATSFDPWWVVQGSGPLGGFELTLDRQQLATGETLVARVRNATDSEQMTGNEMKYDVQYRGDDGWRTVFGIEGGEAPFTDEGVVHDPGSGFTYELQFSAEGLSGAVDHSPTYRVCGSLSPGTYRFVYWGVTTEKERREDFETEYALGRTFTVV